MLSFFLTVTAQVMEFYISSHWHQDSYYILYSSPLTSSILIRHHLIFLQFVLLGGPFLFLCSNTFWYMSDYIIALLKPFSTVPRAKVPIHAPMKSLSTSLQKEEKIVEGFTIVIIYCLATWAQDSNYMSFVYFVIHLVILPARSIHISIKNIQTLKTYVDFFNIYLYSLLKFH